MFHESGEEVHLPYKISIKFNHIFHFFTIFSGTHADTLVIFHDRIRGRHPVFAFQSLGTHIWNCSQFLRSCSGPLAVVFHERLHMQENSLNLLLLCRRHVVNFLSTACAASNFQAAPTSLGGPDPGQRETSHGLCGRSRKPRPWRPFALWLPHKLPTYVDLTPRPDEWHLATSARSLGQAGPRHTSCNLN